MVVLTKHIFLIKKDKLKYENLRIVKIQSVELHDYLYIQAKLNFMIIMKFPGLVFIIWDCQMNKVSEIRIIMCFKRKESVQQSRHAHRK